MEGKVMISRKKLMLAAILILAMVGNLEGAKDCWLEGEACGLSRGLAGCCPGVFCDSSKGDGKVFGGACAPEDTSCEKLGGSCIFDYHCCGKLSCSSIFRGKCEK